MAQEEWGFDGFVIAVDQGICRWVLVDQCVARINSEIVRTQKERCLRQYGSVDCCE